MPATDLRKKTVFIVSGDPATARSQQTLLETHHKTVRTFDSCRDFMTDSLCENDDIVILDISMKSPGSFKLLDMFLNATERPKLIVTTFEKHIFNQGDALMGQDAKILFKPFHPSDLVTTINQFE